VADVDTPLEIALLSYSAGVIDIRPPEAAALLPADNPRLSGQKLGAAVYKELVELRFLDPQNSAAIGRYEAMLGFIGERHGLTRAEIETWYRSNIRSLIAGTVSEEFNKIEFLLENSRTFSARSHTATLTRNSQNGHYTLSYGGAYTNNEIREITASTLDALLAEMGRRKTDFDQTGINQVRAQAALIPAVKLSSHSLDDITTILTSFYTNPSSGTYSAVKDVYVLYEVTRLRSGDDVFKVILDSYYNTIVALNSNFASKVAREAGTAITTLTADQQRRLTAQR
jgi:hypothetical protein